METKDTVTSKQFSINWKDFLRGLIMAIGTPVLVVIQKALEAASSGEPLVINWVNLGMIALGALLVYLTKNFLTPAVTKTPIDNKDINPETPTAAK